MLKIRVIPCMLFNGDWLVKTIRFQRHRTLGNPIQIVRVYNQRNVDELIFLDIFASRDKRPLKLEIISDISKECFMPLSIGGGVKSINDINNLLRIGADKVIINTQAIESPDFIKESAEAFGSQAIVVSIDVKRIGNKHFVFKNNGMTNTGMTVGEWAGRAEELGAGEIFVNSIDNDGKMDGFDVTLFKTVTEAVSIPVIGCGGAGKPEHFSEAVLGSRLSAVSAASIFHYTQYTPDNIKLDMKRNGINVRLSRLFDEEKFKK